MYLADLALKTESFTKLSEDLNLTGLELLSPDGKAFAPGKMHLVASTTNIMPSGIGLWAAGGSGGSGGGSGGSSGGGSNGSVDVRITKLKASFDTKLKHFNTSGVRLTLYIGVKVTITDDNTVIIIDITGSFEEEVRFGINVSGGAIWDYLWGFLPYIRDFEVTANLDFFNYTGIKVDASLVTRSFVENKWVESRELANIAGELEKLLNEEKYIGDGKGTVADGLAEKCRTMLENESGWVTLFEQELYTYEYCIPPIFIIVVGIELNFVVSVDVSVSMGFEFYYENAKRYSYTLQVFAGKVTSDVIDIREERYDFKFCVMGKIGLRAGIEAGIYIALFSTDFAKVGFAAEVGAYVRLYGYFNYHLWYTASKGRSSEYAGALFVEVGIYLDINFKAEASGGELSYSPTLYAVEWPLWTAGMRENVRDFAYEEAGQLSLKKHIRTLTVPNDLFTMTYMDLKTGVTGQKVFDDATYFTIEITNKAFSYNPKTNTLTINPDAGDPIEEGEMIITWAGAPLAFTSAPIRRTIKLYWNNLNNGYTIVFNSIGGSAVPMILACYNAPVTPPDPPVKAGYDFAGWYTDSALTKPYVFPATMPNTDTVVYAKWTPRNDTPYTVEHYQQNLNNDLYTFVESDTQILHDTTDSVVTPQPKVYEGFASPQAKSLTVLPDGSGVVKYYYSRRSYTVTFDPGEARGEPVVYQFKYRQTITASQMSRKGFTFVSWDKPLPDTMPASNLTFVAKWNPTKDTPYLVEHYIQNTAGTGYVLSHIEHKTGSTNQEITIRDFAMFLEGITFEKSTVDGKSAEQATIKGDGTLVVKLYYTRKIHTVSFLVENGDNMDVTYRYGQLITQPSTPVKAGYTFSGWKTSQDLSEDFIFGKPMPDRDITVYGSLIPNTDTRFTVEHYYQNTTGEGYSLNETETKTGTTDKTVDLGTFAKATEGMSFEKSTVDGEMAVSAKIKGDGSLVVKLYYTRNVYTLMFMIENGENSQKTYLFGQSIELPAAAAKAGYTFSVWKSDEALTEAFSLATMPSRNVTAYGKYIPNSDTPYRVMHYQQNLTLNGYDLVEADDLTGVTDTQTNAIAKSYTGFTAKAFEQDIISGDGSTVIRIEYDRNIYNVNLDTSGGSINSVGITSYVYGIGVQLPADITRAGYIFDGWFDSEGSQVTSISASETGNKSFTARWWPAHNTRYTVKHLREDLYGNYTIEEIEVKYGTTDTPTAATEKSYEGFTAQAFTQSNISGYGDTVIEIKYDRNTYRLTWHLENGILSGTYTSGNVKYGTPIIKPNVEKAGYTFSGWYQDEGLNKPYIIPITMPPIDIDIYGKMTANSGIHYKVLHYHQNADDDGYTLKETENLTGYTDELVTATARSYDYFHFNGNAAGILLSGSIRADGSLELRLYYDREAFTVDYLVDGQPYGEQATYKYGQTINYPTPPEKEGYIFDTWLLDGQNFTGTMPGRNIVLTASWSAGQKSYTIRYFLEKLEFTGDHDRWELKAEDSETKVGTYGDTITVFPEKEYTGFETPSEKEVTLNSSLSTVDFYYIRKEYSLTWNLNGGTPTNNYTEGDQVRYGTPIVAPILTRTGYSYTWDKVIAETMPAEALEYTANWTANSYKVRFSEEGLPEITVTYDQTYGASGELPVPSKTGYDFAGWFNDPYAGERITEDTVVKITADQTLYARWTVKYYTLTWNFAGGTASGDYTKGSVPYGASIIPPVPTRTGYDFAGWDKPVVSTMPAEELTYTAKWTPKTYTVMLMPNGGTINSGNVTQYTYGVGAVLPTDVTRDGYTFDGWYEYESGPRVYSISTTDLEDKTYTARWSANKYKITYHNMDGAVNHPNNLDKYTYGVGLTLGNPTKTGHNFEGWFRDAGFTNLITAISKTDIGPIDVYAKWTPQVYNVTLNTDGGTLANGSNITSYTYGSAVLLPTADKISKPGYTFLGWFEDSDFKTPAGGSAGGPAIPEGRTGDVTFYTKWQANTYTVRFHPNGGSGSMADQTFTWGVEQALRSNTFTRNGYSFAGWATSAFGSKVYSNGQKVKNLTEANGGEINLYAVWTIIEYTITYKLNGGTNHSENPAKYTVETKGITLKDSTRSGGYVFDGWYLNSDFSGDRVTNIPAGSTGNLTLYASWKHYGVFNVSWAGGNTFTITRTDGFDGTQTVYYRTQNGSAIGGTHFTHVESSVTFNQGETSKTVTITEKSVSSAYGGNEATRYANSDRVYFLDIYNVEGGGRLGDTTCAARTMAKDANYTVDSSALNNYREIARVSNKNQVVWENDGGNYRTTVTIGLSSPVLDNDAYSNTYLRTYIRNTVSAMKVRLQDFYGKDDRWAIFRHVLFNNHTNNASYTTSDKTNKVPDLPSGTKCALVYNIANDVDNTDNYGVNLPANIGKITASGTSIEVEISDIKWASGQDGGNYVLYGFNETCSITVGAYNPALAISSWTFNSAKLYAAPKDTVEPTLLGVAPMAFSEFKPGNKVIIALVFNEIIGSADGVSIKVDELSDQTFNCIGGVGTNVLYFEVSVTRAMNSTLTKDDITIINSGNIKDMVN